MEPISTTAIILSILAKYGPELMMQAVKLLQKKEVSQEDWDNIFEIATGKSYDDYIKEAQ